MSHFMKRLITALAGVIVAIAWAGAATAGAQTQVDDDFSGGTHDGTELVPPDDLALSPVIDIVEDFDGTALPSGWETVPWKTGGSATVADGLLTVNGARANTTSLYDSNRLLDFAATFTADAFQHVGFGNDFNDAPWAMFSTGGGSLPVGLYARTLAPGGTAMNTPIADVDPLEEHEYSIEWTPTEVVYYVDGEEVAVHEVAISAQMRPIVSDFSAGGGSVIVEYLDLYPVTDTYPAEGTFTSRVFDAGNASATWQTLTAAVDAPEGTGVSFEVRTGTTPTPDATWTDWQPVGAGGALPGPAGRRYLQYRATLTTTDTSFTPFVESVTLGNDVDTTAPAATIGGVTVTGTTATVTFSSTATDVARFECSLDGGTFQTCTSPREFTGLSDGSHTVRVRAIDQAGNVGAAAREHLRHRHHGPGRDDRWRDRDRHDRDGHVLEHRQRRGAVRVQPRRRGVPDVHEPARAHRPVRGLAHRPRARDRPGRQHRDRRGEHLRHRRHGSGRDDRGRDRGRHHRAGDVLQRSRRPVRVQPRQRHVPGVHQPARVHRPLGRLAHRPGARDRPGRQRGRGRGEELLDRGAAAARHDRSQGAAHAQVRVRLQQGPVQGQAALPEH